MSFISNWIFSEQLMFRYKSWMVEMLEKNPRARELGKSECVRCGYCCAVRPCIPTPTELEDIAKYLDMGVKEMVKRYFVADQLGNSDGSFIFPAKTTQRDITGTYIEWDRTYDLGYCVFYDEISKVCKIYPVRPDQAKNTECWVDDKEDAERELEHILSEWRKVNMADYGIEY